MTGERLSFEEVRELLEENLDEQVVLAVMEALELKAELLAHKRLNEVVDATMNVSREEVERELRGSKD